MEEIPLDRLMRFKAGGCGGYWAGYVPNHPYANAAGIVYLHRYLKSIEVGYWIPTELHVHHKDENKLNNSVSNLEILTREDHAKLHNSPEFYNACEYCGKETRNARYCSTKCSGEANKKFSVSKEELELYIWTLGFTKTGMLFKVSDNAIKKRAVSLNCKMPPRYFTQKSIQEKSLIIKEEFGFLM